MRARGAHARRRRDRGGAPAGRGDARARRPTSCAASSRRCCSAAACTWRCSGCTTAGLLAVWLPELEATVDFSQEAGRRAQGRLGAHQAGGAAVGAAAGGALGGAAARHRQGADAHLHARRWRALPSALGGGRAHVRGRGAALPLRQADEAEAEVFDPASPAAQPVRGGVDRLGGAPLRSRAAGAPDRSARSVARGHHVGAAGQAAERAAQHLASCRRASRRCATRTPSCRRCRRASAT